MERSGNLILSGKWQPCRWLLCYHSNQEALLVTLCGTIWHSFVKLFIHGMNVTLALCSPRPINKGENFFTESPDIKRVTIPGSSWLLVQVKF